MYMATGKKTLLQFGAGNIGRSFIGQLFSKAGYEVVFADVDEAVISALNERRGYTVEIRDRVNQSIDVQNVRAVSVLDKIAIINEGVNADIMATAVGPKALMALVPLFAEILVARQKAGKGNIDIILCENLRNASEAVGQGLADPLRKSVGLVETSIGKMVPLIPEDVRHKDPLTVYAESYNTLILDKKAFLNPVPDVPGLAPKENMKAYVDRKSFVHNLGHAALAYFARLTCPDMVFTYEAVENTGLRKWTQAAMRESGRLLISMYPSEFNRKNMGEHIEDLLDRFGNRSLGDTIHRVGRDLNRKLSREDRVAAPLMLCESHNMPAPVILTALVCGLGFDAPDGNGQLFPADAELIARVKRQGPRGVLVDLCGLSGRLLGIAEAAYGLVVQKDIAKINAFVSKEMTHAVKNARA